MKPPITKKAFGERWSEIISSRYINSLILGEDRKWLQDILSSSETYVSMGILNENSSFRVINMLVGPKDSKRKVKVIQLTRPCGTSIPLTKSKVIETLWKVSKGLKTPTETTKKSNTNISAVLKVLRSLITPQLKSYRKELSFPRNCPITERQLWQWSKADVDHIIPFSKLVDVWLELNNLYLEDIKLKGTVNAKKFVDSDLELSWISFHQENATYRLIDSSANRSRGSESYRIQRKQRKPEISED